MHNLMATLKNSDIGLLPVLAKRWDVNIQNLNTDEIIHALHEAMREPTRAEKVWSGLEDNQRGALQMLLGSGGKMPAPMFERVFGEIRKMGAGRIEREKPHENPASIAEALYYRGLIAETFEQAETGARPLVYVPPDLAAILPTHKTGYTAEALGVDAESVGEAAASSGIEPLEEVENIRQADTSIVDDLTTLLAYVQLYAPEIEGDTLAESHRKILLQHLLKPDERRLAFLYGVGLGADLIERQEGRAYTKRAEVRRWLSGKRWEQLKSLAEAWRSTPAYADLWHVPGLHPEPTGWPYDPVVARGAVFNFINDHAPKNEWWSLDEFIITLKEINPDFQRPGGDYESWYIRNDEGEYLHGFESWDAVEGAVLEFYLLGPMHWLGLVDLAEDAARLTAYGRAFIGGAPWPSPAEPEDKIAVQSDGTMLASRKVPRIDRFQLARFTMWQSAGDPYTYKLDAVGIQRAAEQGITTEHIGAFVQRMIGAAQIPPHIARLLSTWQAGPSTAVTIEQVLVLRTTAPETLDTIWNTPELRRFLGARLGPMAAIVRPDQWQALRDALGEEGMEVQLVE
jgi:hypothetical protein